MKYFKMLSLVILSVFLLSGFVYAQQEKWLGDDNPTGIIYRTGNVGIGTTSPQSNLDVDGVFQIDDTRNNYGGFRIVEDNVGDYNVNFQMGRGGTNGGFRFYSHYRPWGSSGNWGAGTKNHLMSILGNGNVGIGTTSPYTKLHIDNGDITLGHNQSSTLIRTRYMGGAIKFKCSSDSWDRYLQLGCVDNLEVFHPTITVDTRGKVGIGTTSPGTKLSVVDTDISSSYITTQFVGYHGTTSHFIFQNNGGGSAAVQVRGKEESGIKYANFGMEPNGNNKAGITGNVGSFYINAGNVGIGTTNPQSKLAVKGTITAQEVNVTMSGWSDFVFEKDYDLKSLQEVENFINRNKHLPDIPSAKEVEANGVSLGEMQAKLLQKVEELTLYAIEQNKRMVSLEKENEQLKKKNVEIDELKERIARLEGK